MDRQTIEETSRTLRELMLDPKYSPLWEARIGRRQAHALHQSGICQVIADYLVANGLQGTEGEVLPRRLKDRVYRALAGRSLSLATLRWFIEAFSMTSDDAAALLRVAGSARSGDAVISPAVVKAGVLPPRRHHTVSLREWHRVGPDGLPESHRTVHEIGTDDAPLERYPYIFDTDAAAVRVVRGGRCSEPYALNDGLFAVDILLDEPLLPGRTTVVECETVFWYRTPPAPEFRRAAIGRLQNVQMNVQFHQLRLPRRVWWSEWPALDAPPSVSDVVELDSEKSVGRSLPVIEQSVVGFRWEIGPRRR
ncbi:MAG: hypothetical protein QM582_06795 [Micropruina sp.]|uniref:hypothetical protein n=1 Tax=Micropruina sp. TaxID=2737536 RepID=UPI0039E5F6A1